MAMLVFFGVVAASVAVSLFGCGIEALMRDMRGAEYRSSREALRRAIEGPGSAKNAAPPKE
jgi:hypothetical protein